MNAEDFQALKDDIEVNGQREPVTVFEDMVLDGWHRYRACVELDIKPTKFNFDASEDPAVFVMSQNLHRRHLTASQRVAAVVACSAWRPAGKKPNIAATAMLQKTNEQIAKEAGAKVRTVTDVKAAKTAGLIDLVVEGALTAEEAGKIARGTPAKKPTKPAAKTPLTVVLAPVIPPEDQCTELDMARDQIADLQSMLAVANLGTVSEADKDQAKNLIAELRAEIKTLRATLKAVTTSRDGLMNELAQVKRQCIAQQRELKSYKGNKAA